MSCTFDSTCRPADVIGENGEICVLTRIRRAGHIYSQAVLVRRSLDVARRRIWIQLRAKQIHW